MAVLAALVIGAYQILINKYYWGAAGPPNKQKRDKKAE
jgi:hypothetical protein